MKIIQITPGSGDNFYCENCLRDAAIVQAWRRLGHDALIVPLYLPLQMDQQKVGNLSEIFMGGINVYLQQKSALFRNTPRWLDRLFDRPGLLRWAARRAGTTDARDLADTTISMLQGEQGCQVKELERLVDWLSKEHIADVICLSNALLAGLARRLKKVLQIPVVCLLQDEDDFLDALPEPHLSRAWDTLRSRTEDIDKFIAVSQHYADEMQKRLNLNKDNLAVVHPGINSEDITPAPGPAQTVTIGFLSRMNTNKGLDILVEAFIILKSNPKLKNIKLALAGGKTGYDKPCLDKIKTRLKSCSLLEDVQFHTDFDPSKRHDFLRSLTVLSVPETKSPALGFYILEALATAVPVVQPPVGVFRELHELIGEAVKLTEANNPEALARALEPLVSDPVQAHNLGRQGREKLAEILQLERCGEKYVGVFQQVISKYWKE